MAIEMNSYDLKDRVAIITGGGQGIGLAVAERMLESGASVAIWEVDRKLIEALDTKYGKTGKVQTVFADIGKLDSVEAATQATLERFGKIDILINNAAIVGPNATTWEYPP
jgi:2-dehydro-3-deoxy-L-rhamnonate dehydrogenase (NAD+)